VKAFHEKNIYPNGFPVDIIKFNKFSFLAHWHIDIEVVHIYEGQLRMTVNSETRILSAGETCICCSGDIHSFDSEDLCCNGILVFFGTEIIGPQIKWPADSVFLTPFIDDVAIKKYGMCPDFSEKVGDILIDVHQEIEEKKDCYQVFVRSRLLELHGLITRNVPKRANIVGHMKRYSMLNKIQNSLDYINANYMEDITLSDTIVQAGLETSQFSKLFKHMCGMSFITYLNNIRTAKAEEMLINTTLPITEIAFECGFKSLRNFNRTFKNIKGLTPSDIRKLALDTGVMKDQTV
jgi:AraC-like DNA-binding protein